jgi:hypothetical protein
VEVDDQVLGVDVAGEREQVRALDQSQVHARHASQGAHEVAAVVLRGADGLEAGEADEPIRTARGGHVDGDGF